MEAIAFARLAHGTGHDDATCAAWLGLAVETLRRWRTVWRESQMPVRARGRPPSRGDPIDRQTVIHVLTRLASRVGLPTLRRCFPSVPRGELIELQQRCRRVVNKRRPHETVHVLRWTRPGSTWAFDFTQPPCPIDGCFPRLTAVRDLASGQQLSALPSCGEQAGPAVRLLGTLAEWHGVPLVIKLDNGSAMRSDELKQWAEDHGILLLYSPPGTPEYNGAAEAGIGSISTRAYHHAVRHGRATRWTCDDIFAAISEANETARSWSRNGDSPAERWRGRIAISNDERERFMTCYRDHQQRERAKRGIGDDVHLQHYEQASIDRFAITRTLTRHGYLHIRRRRIPLRVSKKKVLRIA